LIDKVIIEKELPQSPPLQPPCQYITTETWLNCTHSSHTYLLIVNFLSIRSQSSFHLKSWQKPHIGQLIKLIHTPTG